ncbi:DUF6192 family protein [Streptomyces sp. NBC_00347]|uniref:DUF6192 family protein n=1 Tax=Streptomyces sp. NBC_00347 TaxID=2975721 RepID=UPI00338FD458
MTPAAGSAIKRRHRSRLRRRPLRRPDVAFKARPDDRARHEVNHAQVERGRQGGPGAAGPAPWRGREDRRTRHSATSSPPTT